MKETIQKSKRIKPIIKIRQNQFDQELVALNQIRQKKLNALEELKECQNKYLESVDLLNQERQSADRNRLTVLETGLDMVKTNWLTALSKVRELEGREKAQTLQTLMAEKSLKSVEKLDERYVTQINDFTKHQEQIAMDEIALRRFSNN